MLGRFELHPVSPGWAKARPRRDLFAPVLPAHCATLGGWSKPPDGCRHDWLSRAPRRRAALIFLSCLGTLDCLGACLILPLDGELPVHEDDVVATHTLPSRMIDFAKQVNQISRWVNANSSMDAGSRDNLPYQETSLTRANFLF
jgi:hypothetical protein